MSTPNSGALASASDAAKTPGQIACDAYYGTGIVWDTLGDFSRQLWERSAAALAPPAVVPESVRRLPRLTDAMVRAACKAHYGVDMPDGIDLTVRDHNYSFRQGLQRMWRGIRASLAEAAPSGRADTTPSERYGTGPGWTTPHDGSVSPEVEAACRRIAARRAGGAYADAVGVSEAAWRSEIHSAEAALFGIAPPAGGGAVDIEAAAEIVSAAYYDAMIGQVPHTHGWAGKPEEFKRNVRARMADALRAAGLAAAPEPTAGGGREIVDPELSALADAASASEQAYGTLWRLTAFDESGAGYARDARKALLAFMDKDGQRRGIAWATRHYGPLGPDPRLMLSDEDRMEMGL